MHLRAEDLSEDECNIPYSLVIPIPIMTTPLDLGAGHSKSFRKD